MSDKLLPCPFCGGEAVVMGSNDDPFFMVVCLKCNLKAKWYHDLKDEAIMNWNTRSYPLDTAEDVEFLSELWGYIKFCRNASVKDIRQIHDRARDIIAKGKSLYEKPRQDKSAGIDNN